MGGASRTGAVLCAVLMAALIAAATAAAQTSDRIISSPRFVNWSHWGQGRFEWKKVHDRTIYTTRGGFGLLWFEESLNDFSLRFGFKVGREGGNSGVFLRVPDPIDESHVHEAFEVQIDPDGTGTSATGAIYDVQPPLVTIVPQPGEWYRMRIVAEGERIRVYIDGLLVNDFTARTGGTVESYQLHGHLGLQNHSDADVVSYQKIRLRTF